VAALLLAQLAPLVVKAYAAIAFVLSLGLLSGYLFRGYAQYLELRQVNKWGVLAVW
jgi:hypothetical protein